jgi:hypothetical protein
MRFKFAVNSSGHHRQSLRNQLPTVDSEFGFGGGFWGHGLLCFGDGVLFVWW